MHIFFVSSTDANSMLSAVTGLEKLMLEFLTTHRLRIYDLHTMRWDEIDFDKSEITVWDIDRLPVSRTIEASDYIMESLAELKSLSLNEHYVFSDDSGEQYSLEMMVRLVNHAMSVGGVVFQNVGMNDFWSMCEDGQNSKIVGPITVN